MDCLRPVFEAGTFFPVRGSPYSAQRAHREQSLSLFYARPDPSAQARGVPVFAPWQNRCQSLSDLRFPAQPAPFRGLPFQRTKDLSAAANLHRELHFQWADFIRTGDAASGRDSRSCTNFDIRQDSLISLADRMMIHLESVKVWEHGSEDRPETDGIARSPRLSARSDRIMKASESFPKL